MGSGNREDMVTIHQLLGDHKKIKRTVTKLANGVQTLTESADPKVAASIKEHALAMQKRVKDGRPIRNWDPLFAEIFQNHTKISMTVTLTKNGVKVTETSKDPYVATLVQWHAEGVSGFVKEGMAGMHKEHPAPPKPGARPQVNFVGMGDGVTTCPVTGEPISKSVSAEIQGRTVYFCCAGCIEKVQKEPSRYLKWAKAIGN
jgi:YHS domain-containing protein